MELKKRQFIAVLAAAAAAVAAAGWAVLRAPARVVTAIRGGRYPGRVIDVDPADVRKPSKWVG